MTKLQTFGLPPFVRTRGGAGCRVRQLGLRKTICVVFAFCVAAAVVSPAQTFTTLADFDGSDGNGPAGVVQGTDGNFYGTTSAGGANGDGELFKITPAGKLTTVYSFCSQVDCAGGFDPVAGVVLGTDGNFYGTAVYGGANNQGTVFKITPAGKLTTLHSFDGSDGEFPNGGLIQSTDGDFYGTMPQGGANGEGTVFKMTPGGTLTTLHSFGGTDGAFPFAGVVQATDGSFYGTTAQDGAYGGGTVFKITATGTLTTLYSFCEQTSCADGKEPSWLIQATDGDFYGITVQGGRYNACTGGCGTIFKITPVGKLSTPHNFGGTVGEGSRPYAGLVQGTDGNFYGTTTQGGHGYGTFYKFAYTSGRGVLTTLYSFDDGADGFRPQAQVIQSTDGIFYSTTNGDLGTVFSLSMGLDPFVSFVRGTAEVGRIVEILGQGFTGTTGVLFNGTAAAFTIERDTYLKATVPAGATTGPVTVTTPGGTLTSNAAFRVMPQILSFTPTSGPVGTQVTVTGVSLTQTTAVAFCGVPASFTVDSDSQITVTIPTGAATDEIAIRTAGGKVWSAGDFTVTP